MKKVTKAVIPAAGLGTRVLPATKAMPKGMLPLVDKPAIQYLVEEAVRSGITDILISLGRNQSIIEDHFDRSPELEEKLAKPGKEKMLEECLGIANMANILFVRQKETLGLGHAVNTAKAFTGDDPFVVIYGDDVIWGEDPVCAQLIRAYEEFGRPAAGVSAVPWEDVSRYCSLKTTPLHDNYFIVDDMIEKPKKGQEFSNYSILGRVLLTPEIYEILAHTKPGAAHQRHSHTNGGDQGGDGACLDQLLQVRAKAGGEHEHHNADLCKDGDRVADLHQVQQAGADEQAGDDLTHHLRSLALTRHQSEEFRAQDYDCQISKQRIHGLSSFNFSHFPATAGAPALPYCRESVYIIVLFTKKCKTFFIALFVKKA